MDCNEWFTFSISLIVMMPSAVYSPSPSSSTPQSSLSLKLRAWERVEHKHCQWLLTLFRAGYAARAGKAGAVVDR